MNLPLGIALRYSLSGRGFLSFVTWMSVAGVALGVAVLVIVLSVMNGFDRELRDRVLGALPHGLVEADRGFDDWRSAVARAENVPGVLAAAPLVRGPVLVTAGERMATAQLFGIEPEAERRVSVMPRAVDSGRIEDLQPGTYGVIAGRALMDALDLRLGDELVVVLPDARLTLAGAFPRQKQVRIVGTFELGTELDASALYLHLDDARRLLRVTGEAQAIRIRVENLFRSEGVLRAVLRAEDRTDLRGYDWKGTHGNLHAAIALQKRIMFVLLSLLIAVAAFNVVAMITMVVRNRRGDIAILRSMGMQPRAVVQIFFRQGVIIAALGLTMGLLIGTGATLLIPDLVSWLSELSGRDFMAQYFVHELPVQTHGGDLVAVAVVAMAISMLTIWLPARRALRVQPARELRHE